jgi:hypothetical protein
MAEVAYTVLLEPHHVHNRVKVVKWSGLANGDTGAPLTMPFHTYKSVQVYGTFGVGGNCRIEGANEVNSPVWAPLVDLQGSVLDFPSAQIKQAGSHAWQIRPHVTAGDATTSLTVVIAVVDL